MTRRRTLAQLELQDVFDALKRDRDEEGVDGDGGQVMEEGKGKGEEEGGREKKRRRRRKILLRVPGIEGSRICFSNNRLNVIPRFDSKEFETVVECDFCGNFIHTMDFNAFQSFTNLRFIDFGANRLRFIPGALRSLLHLEELLLNNNCLERIIGEEFPSNGGEEDKSYKGEDVLSKLQKLRVLDLKSNRISVIENLKHNTALERLSLSCNKVESIDVTTLSSSYPNLTSLGLFGNLTLQTESGITTLIEVFSSRAPNLRELILAPANNFNITVTYHERVMKAWPCIQWLDFGFVGKK